MSFLMIGFLSAANTTSPFGAGVLVDAAVVDAFREVRLPAPQLNVLVDGMRRAARVRVFFFLYIFFPLTYIHFFKLIIQSLPRLWRPQLSASQAIVLCFCQKPPAAWWISRTLHKTRLSRSLSTLAKRKEVCMNRLPHRG